MSEILVAKSIFKAYANQVALEDVSISIPKQSIFGLLGPNGAGKTTLIRIITQIIGKDAGEIYFEGHPLSVSHIEKMGYMPEERGLYKKMKVGEQLLYLAQLKGLSKSVAMSKLKEWFIKFEIKAWWDKKIEDLSKGMQQKVQFIATVLHEPSLIILDEPFTGFDPVNARLIQEEILQLREKGCTIIFSTHRMETVEELCDHVALINKSKKVLDGPARAIKEQFKANTYIVEFEGNLNGTSSEFKILDKNAIGNNSFRASFELGKGVSANDLLASLISQVKIHNFYEKVPSFNEIFIKVVTGNEKEEIGTEKKTVNSEF